MNQYQFNWLKLLRIVLLVFAVWIVLYIIFIVYNLVVSSLTPDSLTVDYSKTTIDNSEAKNIASQFYWSMHRFGSNEQKFVDLLTPLNSDDLRFVYNKFGKRLSYFEFPSYKGYIPRNLVEWIRDEFDSSEPAYKLAEQRFKSAKIPWA